jgi:HK97 family phage prohead protease
MPELQKHEMRFLQEPSFALTRAGKTNRLTSGAMPLFLRRWSEDLGWFREKIQPGASANMIEEADARALWNHDPNYVLGRNNSETLQLREDEKGLAVDITPPDTQWARDLMISMKGQDITR